MRCGLLGEKLLHSYSPQIHKFFGNYSYQLFEKSLQELPIFLRDGDFTGLNITMPYKKAVIPFCTQLSDCAQKLGAVNTIIKCADGSLFGHNTDYFGFHSLLIHSGLNLQNKKVLVLGSGGASVTAVTVLKELGAIPIVISRNGQYHYQNLHLHRDASVIVNTTPVGMYPNTGFAPIALDDFPVLEGVLDVIYNPARTKLLLDAEKKGLVTENGLWMLVAQAKQSAELFLGRSLSDDLILSTYNALQKQTENTVLIGMPGCGKSTVGHYLATITGKIFVDTDKIIEQRTGRKIPDLFRECGENYFRSIESAVLEEMGKQSGLIIATGGGCVTRSENYDFLHQNGRIFWLQREISLLPTDGRPLSQTYSVENMYKVREPLYKCFADHIIRNDSSPENVAQTIAVWEDHA